MANVIDALSFERTPEGRRYINYRNLSVQQLGSIYERLLEHEVVREGDDIAIRPNIFARKGSGSYYTPDDLVALIIRETVAPLIDERLTTFRAKAEEQAGSDKPLNTRLGALKRSDPAEQLLELKICDPAMGSGHFLVTLVDYLADQVITAMAEAEATITWGHYVSPLANRIEAIRNTILGNAEQRGWTVDEDQLDDRHIIRRMILKRCIYGVDKNLMAVELAKVALWLHTFTVGAPLSFLDHHLRCGDSLFGLWVNGGFEKASFIENGTAKKAAKGHTLFLHEPMNRALRAASSMQIIEGLENDALIRSLNELGLNMMSDRWIDKDGNRQSLPRKKDYPVKQYAGELFDLILKIIDNPYLNDSFASLASISIRNMYARGCPFNSIPPEQYVPPTERF